MLLLLRINIFCSVLGENNYCFNTRGGYKCTDVKCPPDYEPERNRKHRCRLTDEARRCPSTSDLECIRRPVSLSYNFLTLGKGLHYILPQVAMASAPKTIMESKSSFRKLYPQLCTWYLWGGGVLNLVSPPIQDRLRTPSPEEPLGFG